jgi:hypothetical protein
MVDGGGCGKKSRPITPHSLPPDHLDTFLTTGRSVPPTNGPVQREMLIDVLHGLQCDYAELSDVG